MNIRKFSLLWPFLVCLFLPLLASWFVYPQTHLPPEFGVFPPLFVQPAPGFNPYVFALFALICIAICLLYLFPRLFGFKAVQPGAVAGRVSFPVWFWIGAVVMVFFWWLMWARVTPFGSLVYYAFTPLWWGFILVLDGLVFRRSGGRSFLATRPKAFVISALVSLVGWCLFEYFDYFVLSSWYYPNSEMPELTHGTIVVLFLLAYTTVWPAIFEWYTLLMTFPKLATRYSQGPKLALSGNLVMWAGFLMIVLMVVFPYPLFWTIWVGPLLVMSGLLIQLNIWSPFTAVARGDWGPLLLVALSSFVNGFVWEIWNYGSAHPDMALQTNPNFWQYEVPYVNVIHIFAEMPLLGYFGYLPFGILVWVFFIWAGALFGFDSRLDGDSTSK